MKKNIFAFILGGILIGTITGVVALNYNAKNISYTPSDNNWNVNNVEDAIKDLKNNKKGTKVLVASNLNSNESHNISVTDIPNYSNLTSSNFIIEAVELREYYGDYRETSENAKNIVKNYNAENGTLNINYTAYICAGYTYSIIYNVYCIY